MHDDRHGADRRARTLRLVALALAAALLAGGWAWYAAAGDVTMTPATGLPAPARVAASNGRTAAAERTAPAVSSTASSSASAVVAASRAMTRDAISAASVCDLGAKSGAGGLATAPGDDPVPAVTLSAGLRDARRTMRASSDPEVRALAVLLDSRMDHDADRLVAERAALAREAAQSDDPRLYRIALQACRGQPAGADGGACRLLEPMRSAQLDADNAMPWLAMLAATRASDATAVTSASLFHAAHASRIDDDDGLYAALVERGLPPDTPRWLRQRMLLLAIGLQASEPAPQFATIARLCSATALADANRAQDCDALAQLLATRGRTLMALLAGQRLGERLHWRADRLQALAQKARAILAVQQQWTLDAAGSDCASVERQRHWVQQMARLGEVGAAQAAIDASGIDGAQWVQRAVARERAWRTRDAAELAAAASAAEAERAVAAGAGG